MSHAQILVVHIPKTAGTSLWSMLSTRFDQSAILRINEIWTSWPQLAQQADAYRLVVGHVGYGFVTAFGRRPTVVTLLRNPIERAVSAYCHLRHLDSSASAPHHSPAQRQKRVRLERRARELSLLDFVRTEPQAADHLGNIQTWYLASTGIERQPYRDLRADDLDRAKENLSQCDCVGLTERFADSVTMLCHTLQWEPFAGTHHANATPHPAVKELDSPTLDALRHLTELDEELYRFAKELVERRWRAMLADPSAKTSRGAAAIPPALSLGEAGSAVFTFDRAIPGNGWYGAEQLAGRWFCWTGPSHDAWLRLAGVPRPGTLLRLQVMHALKPEVLSRTQLLIDDTPLVVRVQAEAGGHVLEAELPENLTAAPQGTARLVIRVPELYRPCDLDPTNPDRRLLGLAITSISLVPKTVPAAAVSPAEPS